MQPPVDQLLDTYAQREVDIRALLQARRVLVMRVDSAASVFREFARRSGSDSFRLQASELEDALERLAKCEKRLAVEA